MITKKKICKKLCWVSSHKISNNFSECFLSKLKKKQLCSKSFKSYFSEDCKMVTYPCLSLFTYLVPYFPTVMNFLSPSFMQKITISNSQIKLLLICHVVQLYINSNNQGMIWMLHCHVY